MTKNFWYLSQERYLHIVVNTYLISLVFAHLALYGALFVGNEEAAFSNYRLWESLGFLIAYILQTQICVDAKLWILLGLLSIGMTGYLVVETVEYKKRHNQGQVS